LEDQIQRGENPIGTHQGVPLSDRDIRKQYGTKRVALAVIACARQIAEVIHAWHPDAPLREFDFVMVRYGQKPGDYGITRSLHDDWLPVQRIMEWHP
jgi:hypothetical protein